MRTKKRGWVWLLALVMTGCVPSWNAFYLEENPQAIKHRVVFDGSVVLAAGTAELQQFVIAHLGEDEFFGGAMELKRR